MSGPVDENYRLGPGDQLVLILTGDVEQAYSLEVTREGFIVIPQVGQVYAANLTLEPARGPALRPAGQGLLRRAAGPDARTKFQISLARLRNIQVYVAGDVVRPAPTRFPRPVPRSRHSTPPVDPPATAASGMLDRPPRPEAGGQPRSLRVPVHGSIPPTSGSTTATSSSCRSIRRWSRWRARSSGRRSTR